MASGDDDHIPLLEERLHATKAAVVTDRLRVATRGEPVAKPTTLRRMHATIEHDPHE